MRSVHSIQYIFLPHVNPVLPGAAYVQFDLFNRAVQRQFQSAEQLGGFKMIKNTKEMWGRASPSNRGIESLDPRRGITNFFDFYTLKLFEFLPYIAMGGKSAPLPWIRVLTLISPGSSKKNLEILKALQLKKV